MKTKSNRSYRSQADMDSQTAFGPTLVVALASSARYTCVMHPETTSDTPQACLQCGAALVPTDQAVAHAAKMLRSLSAAAQALRRYPM